MKKIIISLVLLVMLCSMAWADLGEELLSAVWDGDLAEVERLIEIGADVNAQDDYDMTALMWAANEGYTEIVELLIDAGADVNLQDEYGWTALMVAANTEIRELLKAAGAVE